MRFTAVRVTGTTDRVPLADLLRDLRFAFRSLRREPAFVIGVVLTFALAIGANASIFGLVSRLMLAPPPGVRDASRVVRIQFAYGSGSNVFTMSTTSYPAFQTVESLGGAFRAVAAVRPDTATVGDGAELSEVSSVGASGDYFALLEVRPALGRVFDRGDDALPNGNDVVVLGYAYWQRRYAGGMGALGSQLTVNGQRLTVIGVTPRGFNGTESAPVDLYLPLTTASRSQGSEWFTNPGMRAIALIARLQDSVSARAAGQRVVAALHAGSSGDDRLVDAPIESLVPGRSARQSSAARITLWLGGVTLIVLLIATANVGMLFLLRGARRAREHAVRMALGASRRRLVQATLVESTLLAIVGGAAGLVFAHWFDAVVRATLLPGIAAPDGLGDRAVFEASVIASVFAGMAAGLVSATRFGRRDLLQDLHTGGGHGSSRRLALQHVLVGIQVALCALLLVGAGLFVRSLDRVRSQDLGFSTAHLLTVSLDFRDRLTGKERDLAHEDAVRRLEAVPGVTAATVVQGMPFSSHHIPPINIPGYVLPPPGEQQLPIMYGATPKYLTMMGVKLLEGRLFTDADREGAPLVVLVNETMARTAWPGVSALGRCVRAGHPASLDDDPMAAAASLPCREVVGVVKDSRARSLRTEGNEDRLMQYYVPFPQLPPPPIPNPSSVHSILVETSGPPERLVGIVQRAVQASSRLPVSVRAQPYQELIDPQLRSWRLGATLFSAFGALALGIAAVGLFAAISYLATQRAPELGVRVALGGSGAGVATLVVGDAVRMAGAGAAGGILIALIVAPVVQPLLFHTTARDPAVIGTAAFTILTVSVVAAALPSWRASRVDPMSVLRRDT